MSFRRAQWQHNPMRQAGLALFKSQYIDCIVLELGLPDMNCLEVLANFLPVSQCANIPVIILKGFSNQPT